MTPYVVTVFNFVLDVYYLSFRSAFGLVLSIDAIPSVCEAGLPSCISRMHLKCCFQQRSLFENGKWFFFRCWTQGFGTLRLPGLCSFCSIACVVLFPTWGLPYPPQAVSLFLSGTIFWLPTWLWVGFGALSVEPCAVSNSNCNW